MRVPFFSALSFSRVSPRKQDPENSGLNKPSLNSLPQSTHFHWVAHFLPLLRAAGMDLLPGLSMEGRSKSSVSVWVRKAVGTQVLNLGPLSPSVFREEFSADLLSCPPSVQLKGASVNFQRLLCSRCGTAGRGHHPGHDSLPLQPRGSADAAFPERLSAFLVPLTKGGEKTLAPSLKCEDANNKLSPPPSKLNPVTSSLGKRK